MFQEIPVFEENIFAYKVTGKLTEADYQDFLPKLTTLIHKYGPLSLLLELEDFQGLEPKAAWEDFKFATAHNKDFKKIAILGDKHWEQWMTVLASSLSKTKFHYFESRNSSEAWDWLRAPDEETQTTTKEEGQQGKLKSYRHILVAIDYSPHSDRAIQRAQELTKQYKAGLSIVHVVNHPGYYGDSHIMLGISTYDDDLGKNLFESSEKRMTSIKEKFGLQDAHSEILWGTPKTTILSYAEAQQVDLIVMGSHGRRGLAKLIGSTTNGVINNARCDVLSVSI